MLMYAENKRSPPTCLQPVHVGGKDGAIQHVMGAMNRQGCGVQAFKVPYAEEAAHDFLWRIHKRVGGKGTVTVFSRSHYEDVLVVSGQARAACALFGVNQRAVVAEEISTTPSFGFSGSPSVFVPHAREVALGLNYWIADDRMADRVRPRVVAGGRHALNLRRCEHGNRNGSDAQRPLDPDPIHGGFLDRTQEGQRDNDHNKQKHGDSIARDSAAGAQRLGQALAVDSEQEHRALFKQGAKLWPVCRAQCHSARPGSEFSPAQWNIVMVHMRTLPNPPAKDQRAIAEYLKTSH
jgi:hypothetical protein